MQNQLMIVQIAAIKPRENSQRKKQGGVAELADSIKRNGLLHPVVLSEDFQLIAGETRVEACKLLGLTEIAATFKSNLSPLDKRIIELEENTKRTDLIWQDQALAMVDLETGLKVARPELSREERAAYVGMSYSYYARWIHAGKAILGGNKRVEAAPGISAAINILERESARKQDNTMNKLFDELTGAPEKTEEDEEKAQASIGNPKSLSLPTGARRPEINPKEGSTFRMPAKPEKAIFQADFIQWAEAYSGPRFNLIHCDFPYGLDHGKSDQGGAKDRWDSYEDQEDIYWRLIEVLCAKRDAIMSPSCHMIFWFSMKFYAETLDAFARLAPDLDVDYNPLIWHKTDNKGIIRDVEHTPRHVYETALFITRGGRQIIKAVGDAYGAPTRKSEAQHISEKPVPVLRHFMQLCVDGHTELIDPTCGGGSAIRAASSMGAKRVLGLELNSDYAQAAQKEYESQISIEALRKEE